MQQCSEQSAEQSVSLAGTCVLLCDAISSERSTTDTCYTASLRHCALYTHAYYMCTPQLIGSELCGESLVALDETGSEGRWIPLHDKHNSRVGELLLRMAYTGPRVTGASPMRATSVSTSATPVYTPVAPPAAARRSSGSGSDSGSSAGRPSPRRQRLVVPAAAAVVGASPVRNSPGTVRVGSNSPPELVRRSSGAARGSVDTARMNSSSHSSSSNSSSGSPPGSSSSRQRGSVVRPAMSPQQQQQQQQQRSSGGNGDSKGKSGSSGDAAGTGAAQQPRPRRLLSFLHLVSTYWQRVSCIRLTMWYSGDAMLKLQLVMTTGYVECHA
jgi:hypothetical protein